MSGYFWRSLSLIAMLQIGAAHAQQASPGPNLNLGDAVVTGFSGTVPPDPTKLSGKSAADLTFINPDGPSARIVDIRQASEKWDARDLPAAKPFDVRAGDVGQVFGVALDDQTPLNIYLSATSAFGLQLVARGPDGQPVRVKQGGPGEGWMKGQFGLELQGGPGSIFKVDGKTGVVSLFANVALDGVPNPAPALGSLAFDAEHQQLFVSDLYTGMIHRFDLNGDDLGHFDHGVAGRAAAQLAPVPFDSSARPNIAVSKFDTQNPDTWGYAPTGRRVWGLALHEGRLFYSVAEGPQIWSIGIQKDGGFADDPRWELDVPAQPGRDQISDILFSQKGAMILAQRAPVAASYDDTAFTAKAEPRVLRYWLENPKKPENRSRWIAEPEEYAVGFADDYRNTNGGVALGYGYGPDGALDAKSCEAALWTTGQDLRDDPALQQQLLPGGPLVVHGLHAVPAAPVRPFNQPPWTSYSVDYESAFHDPTATGHLGQVRIWTTPCAEGQYGGPGYVASAAAPAAGGAGANTGGGVNPGGACFTPTSLSLPPCTQPGQPVSLDLSTPTNWTVAPGGPPIPAANPAYTANPGNWIEPSTPTANTVNLYTYTRPFNLPCCPKSYTMLTLSGSVAADNSVSLNLNTCTIATCHPGSLVADCFSTIHGNPTAFGPISPACFNCGLNTLTATVWNQPGTPTGLSVVAKLTATCGSDCVCGCPPGAVQQGNQCVSSLGSLIVQKVITSPTGAVLPAGMYTVQVTATCTPPSNTFGPFPVVNGVPYPINNIPLGDTCTVTENTSSPPPPPPNACPAGSTPVWSPPTYTPSNVVVTGTPVTITVNNTWTCKREEVGSLIVEKQVVYDGPVALPSQIYPVTVTCGSAVTNLNLVNGAPQTVSNIPLGASCSVVEGTAPTPAHFCPSGTTPVWTTVYVPPSPITITGMGITETVKNTLSCVSGPLTCPPPMVQGPVLGECVCPAGTVLRGKECVRPVVCRSPLVPNAADTACVCPAGTVLRGKECMRPVVCRSPMIENGAGGCLCPRGMTNVEGRCVPSGRNYQRETGPGIRIPFGPGGGAARPANGAIQ